MSCNLRAFSSLAAKRRYTLKSPAFAFLKLNMYDYHQRTSAASRWSSTRLNSVNTAADSPDTPERQIVGGKRRSMNQSDIRMREYLCRRLSAARRRQKYEPGFTLQWVAHGRLLGSHCQCGGGQDSEDQIHPPVVLLQLAVMDFIMFSCWKTCFAFMGILYVIVTSRSQAMSCNI